MKRTWLSGEYRAPQNRNSHGRKREGASLKSCRRTLVIISDVASKSQKTRTLHKSRRVVPPGPVSSCWQNGVRDQNNSSSGLGHENSIERGIWHWTNEMIRSLMAICLPTNTCSIAPFKATTCGPRGQQTTGTILVQQQCAVAVHTVRDPRWPFLHGQQGEASYIEVLTRSVQHERDTSSTPFLHEKAADLSSPK